MLQYTSSIDLGKMLLVISSEENPLVKADLLKKYVKALDENPQKLKNPQQLYQKAQWEYEGIITLLSDEDKDLKSALEKRARYCAQRANGA